MISVELKRRCASTVSSCLRSSISAVSVPESKLLRWAARTGCPQAREGTVGPRRRTLGGPVAPLATRWRRRAALSSGPDGRDLTPQLHFARHGSPLTHDYVDAEQEQGTADRTRKRAPLLCGSIGSLPPPSPPRTPWPLARFSTRAVHPRCCYPTQNEPLCKPV